MVWFWSKSYCEFSLNLFLSHIYRCVTVEANILTISRFICLFYQTHSKEHTGLQMIENSLANSISTCSFFHMWEYGLNMLHMQVDMAIIPSFNHIQSIYKVNISSNEYCKNLPPFFLSVFQYFWERKIYTVWNMFLDEILSLTRFLTVNFVHIYGIVCKSQMLPYSCSGAENF